MKNLNSYLSLSLVVVFLLATSFAKTNKSMVDSKINSYLTSVDTTVEADQVVVYSNLIIKEQGDFYTVDFMVEEDGEIVILNKEFEPEYYIMEDFNTINLVKYSYPVISVNTELGHRA